MEKPFYKFNQSHLLNKRRKLRKDQTEAEAYLWYKLRNQQMDGFKFFRQYSVCSYILDFYCPKIRLAIELDGSQHLAQADYDQKRTSFLEEKKIKVLRFWNNQVLEDIDVVLEVIWEIVHS